ncbi:MAG: hypothetical protein B6I36_01785 [Desulfobacteraceae bacterium 4572_35.1]|nr:MAG: hypothetical protein B6I36_01785 [Desulfobacteraceae bacterium 4572_35.1]
MVKHKLHNQRITTLVIAVTVLVITPITAWCQLTASISRNVIGISESVTLTLSLSDGGDSEPDISTLNDDFEVVSSSKSSSVNIINGSISHSKEWSIGLLARRTGTLTIPALCNGNNCTKPITVTVKDQTPATANSAAALLETTVSTTYVMAQAQVIYSVKVLLAQPLAQASLSEIKPQGVETTVHRLGEDLRYEVTRGGNRYQVIERNYALFPQHSGTMELPPLRLDGVMPSRQSRFSSNFGSPFDPMGQLGKRIRLRSNALTVEVVAPPPLDQQQVWLPAQGVEINDDWQKNPPTLTVGEPATRTITTNVIGLAAAALPELEANTPPEFKTYPDKTVRTNNLASTGIVGTMVQKIALVPTVAGTFTLAPGNMKWWNTKTQQWQSTSIPAVTLTVLPAERTATVTPAGDAGVPTTSVSTKQQQLHPTEKNPVKNFNTKQSDKTAILTDGKSDNSTSSKSSLPADNIWIWVSLLFAAGWLVTVLFYRRKNHSSNTNPPHKSNQKIKPSTAHKGNNSSKQQVINLAKAHQAGETRRALTAWLATINSANKSNNNGDNRNLTMDDLLQKADETLRREVNYLDRYLFSQNSTNKENSDSAENNWDGTALALALENLDLNLIIAGEGKNKNQQGAKHQRGSNQNELPSFYPKS